MKIELRNNTAYHTTPVDVKRQFPQSSVSPRNSRNFDGITIQSSKEFTPEQTFVDSLVNRMSLELRTPASPQKIEDLQRQIELGTYEVDANAIADRIMLY